MSTPEAVPKELVKDLQNDRQEGPFEVALKSAPEVTFELYLWWFYLLV